MVLLGYLFGLVLLWFLLRKKQEGTRSTIFLIYHFLFVAAISFSLLYTPGLSASGLVRLVLLSLYQAPMIMGFQVGLDDFTQLQYIIIFVCSAIYTVRTVAVLVFRRFFRDLKLRLLLVIRPEVCLISGELTDAQALAENICAQKQAPALLYLDPNPDGDENQPVSGALTITWNDLYKLSPRKKYHFVLLPEPNQENLSLLRRLEELGKRLDIKVTAFLDPAILRLEPLQFEHIDVWPISREQLLTRQFLSENLPIQRLKDLGLAHEETHMWVPDRPFSLCVVGFSPMCREFLLTTMEYTAIETSASDRHGLDAIIVSDQLPDQLGGFLRDYPLLEQIPSLDWIARGPEEDAFYTTLEQRLNRLDQIMIDAGDTARNIRIALRIQRLCKRYELAHLPQMAVVLHEDAPGSVELLTQEPNVVFLQDNRSRFTYDELIQRRADQDARELHRRYQSETSSRSSSITWSQLDTFTQASNRAVIWDIPNKLALASHVSELPPAEREKLYWQLARYEHRRWNAFHFCRGWTPLSRSELTEEELIQHKTKRPAARRHTCLVDWDVLDTLPQATPGLIKSYDYENVVALFEGMHY